MRAEEHTADPDRIDPPVLAIVGPTASGKSAVAMGVAPRLAAEIVAVDSMTIYRGMDIGTAKPSPGDQKRIPHHLIDIADAARPYSVAQFQRAARATIAGIRARGRPPLLVGGSGLYFRAVVDDLEFPPTDPAVRARVAASGELRALLERADPEAASRIEGENERRIVRALEVLELTGKPFSSFREAWEKFESRYPLRAVGIRIEAGELRRRIELRAAAMFAAGLVEETRVLLGRGLREALTAPRAIGYREAVAVIEGEMSEDEAIAATASATRRYARRQMTWFGRDPRVRWIDGADPEAAADEAFRVLEGNATGSAPHATVD